MTFDAGTWWLALLIIGSITSGLTYLIKTALFGRVDKMEAKIASHISKDDYKSDIAALIKSIKTIEENYTPLTLHAKDYDECREDIKKIKDDYITKEDFFRENAKVDRKIDHMSDKIDKIFEMIYSRECKR